MNVAFVFNGPPGSGKDYGAEVILNESKSPYHLRFKDKLYELTQTIYNIDDSDYFMNLVTDRVLKETPTEVFRGRSPRQALIHVSEDIIKPNFGKDYFGRIVAEKVFKILWNDPNKNIIVVSDTGFAEELSPLAASTPTVLIRVHREGCSFKNDSRSYLYPHRENICVINSFDIYNNGTSEFDDKLIEIFNMYSSKR